MAPSVSEIQQVETAPILVPVKAFSGDEKPKVRRIIDEEGGKTTASVIFCHLFPSFRIEINQVLSLSSNLGPQRKVHTP
jgi:hypothetical protein